MKRLILPALVALVLMSGPALAQQLSGTVSGVVRDAQGGVLPGASVTLTGTALIGGARTDVTSETGAFRFADLPPGMFDVTFELAGFTTMVFPHASAGAIFQDAMASGKFHGVMRTHTPTGSRATWMRLSGVVAGMVSPYTRLASSANHSMNDAP